GRPLLMKVQRTGRGGAALAPWTFSYRHASTSARDVYAQSVAAGGVDTGIGSDQDLDYSRLGQNRQTIDLTGDGLADLVAGKPDGTVAVQVAGLSGAGTMSYTSESWAHPLASASPASIVATEIDATADSDDSNCWHDFEFELSWPGGSGLAYARPLTSAPPELELLYITDPFGGATWDEYEDEALPLGAFQFLSSAHVGPF